ncbi:MAG: hypothetical protein LBK65_07190 [Tannerellaceae bacterium]|jgi:hypothetical protein|nr:hypothetical protein [Tannerellaceae bacterium]
MKTKLFVSLRIIALLIVSMLAGCEKDHHSGGGGAKEEEEVLEDYILIDKCDELGEWDCAVLGQEGLAFLYKFRDNNIPDEIRIWDGNEQDDEKAIKTIMKFNEEGLPHSLIAGDYTFVFANFNENKFDVAILSGREELSFLKEVESNINWSEYLDELSGFVGTRAFNLSRSPIKWVNAVVGAVGCGLSAFSAPTGFGIALTVVSCSGAIVNIVDLFTDDIPTPVSVGSAVIGHYANMAACANLTAVPACLVGLVSNMTQVGDLAFDDARENISIAEGALISGFGEIKVTLTWDFVADVDLHVIEPSGHRIYFGDKYSLTGGFLDFDNTVAYGPENIYWEDAPEGTYEVYLDHYAGNTGGNYTVFVQIGGESRIFRGYIGIDQYIFITRFNRRGFLNDTRGTHESRFVSSIPKAVTGK